MVGRHFLSGFKEQVLGMHATRALLIVLFGGLLHSAQAACPAGALGTSRTQIIGNNGGLAIGLKTYPQTLALADHEVVLTFDDGPLPGTTPAVLDALARECVQATFFLIGRNSAASPALVRREVADGHTVGHHTFSHPSLTLRGLTDAAARADIDRGFAADDRAAYGSAGTEPRVPFFRFPGFGDTKPLLDWLGGRNITPFGADLWASDWLEMTPDAELALVMRRLQQERRGILLLHDSRPATAAMLPDLLAALKKGGYKVVHLVPGGGVTPVRAAPAGWSSETGRTLSRMWPRILPAQ